MSSPLLDTHVSLFDGSTNTTPIETLSLREILRRIQDGTYRSHVKRLRHLLHTKGKDPYDRAKRHSHAFTPAGTFSQRANVHLITPSAVLNFDFDHVADRAQATALLRQDPWVVYAFISPGGDGLKVGIWASGITEALTYTHAWRTVLGYLQQSYPALAIANDQGCKDVSRLCYVSWDPHLYMNPDVQCFAVPPVPAPAPPQPISMPRLPLPRDQRARYAHQALETARHMIAASIPPTATSAGNRHETRLRAARLLGGYVGGGILSYGEAYAALEAIVRDYTENLANALRPIRAGLAYGEAAPITLAELEADWQRWKAAHWRTNARMPQSVPSWRASARIPEGNPSWR